MKNLIRGTAVLGAVAFGAAATLVTAGAATTETSPSPISTTSTQTLTQTGNLNLDAAPTISFAPTSLSMTKQTYLSSDITPTLHVSNPGFSSGWNVTVSATPFTDTTTSAGTTVPLKGAIFSLDNSNTTPLAADDSTNVSAMPSYVNPLTLTPTAQRVESAAVGAGVGQYTATFGKADASLYVPAGNLPGTYTSTVTWTLNDTPA